MALKFGVFESLCANYGLGAAHDLPNHFLQEGYAMLTSICNSLAMSRSIQPVSIVHHRWASELEFPSESTVLSGGNDQENLAQVIQAIETEQLVGLVVIAPEINGELKQLVSALRTKTKVWNCATAFLDLACDKWELAKYCRQRNIPHPRTELLANLKSQSDWENFSGELIIKPRDGAGCMNIAIFDAWPKARHFSISSALYNSQEDWIVQNWITGQHASRSLVCNGSTAEPMPILSQEIIIERSTGGFDERVPHYRGAGQLPQTYKNLGLGLMDQIFGDFKEQCLGWIGFDLLIPEPEADEKDCYLIEINPRFTTSFVYLQQGLNRSILAGQIADFIKSQ